MLPIQSSIIDYQRPSLDRKLWSDEGILLSENEKIILDTVYSKLELSGLTKYKEWLKTISIVGSIGSYFWKSNTDIDVHLWVKDWETFKQSEFPDLTDEEALEYTWDALREINKTPKTKINQHEIEIFIETTKTKSDIKYMYDVLEREWIKPATKPDKDIDIEKEYESIFNEVEDMIEEIDIQVGKVKRQIKSIEDLQEVVKVWDKAKKKLFKQKIQEKVDQIDKEVKEIVDKGTEVIKNRQDGYSETSKSNLIFKKMQYYGYIKLTKELQSVLEDIDPENEIVEDKIPEVKEKIEKVSYENAKSALEYLSKQGVEGLDNLMREVAGLKKSASGFAQSIWLTPDDKLLEYDMHSDIYYDNKDKKKLPKEIVSEVNKYLAESDNPNSFTSQNGVLEIVYKLVDYGWVRVADWVKELAIKVKDKSTLENKEFLLLPILQGRKNITLEVGDKTLFTSWNDIKEKGLIEILNDGSSKFANKRKYVWATMPGWSGAWIDPNGKIYMFGFGHHMDYIEMKPEVLNVSYSKEEIETGMESWDRAELMGDMIIRGWLRVGIKDNKKEMFIEYYGKANKQFIEEYIISCDAWDKLVVILLTDYAADTTAQYKMSKDEFFDKVQVSAGTYDEAPGVVIPRLREELYNLMYSIYAITKDKSDNPDFALFNVGEGRKDIVYNIHNVKQLDMLIKSYRAKYEKIDKQAKGESKEYQFQDANQETIIHNNKWKNLDLRMVLEGTGDIFRELTKTFGNDPGYINKKVVRLNNAVNLEKQIKEAIFGLDKENVQSLLSKWNEQPTSTPEQELAKQLNITLLEGDVAKAKSIATQLGNLEMRNGNNWLLTLPIDKSKIDKQAQQKREFEVEVFENEKWNKFVEEIVPMIIENIEKYIGEFSEEVEVIKQLPQEYVIKGVRAMYCPSEQAVYLHKCMDGDEIWTICDALHEFMHAALGAERIGDDHVDESGIDLLGSALLCIPGIWGRFDSEKLCKWQKESNKFRIQRAEDYKVRADGQKELSEEYPGDKIIDFFKDLKKKVKEKENV